MDIIESHRSFMLSLDKSDTLEYVSFLPEEIDYWINEGARVYSKTRYSGLNAKRESFEQTQKRIDDLRTLVKEIILQPSSFNPSTDVDNLENCYLIDLPNWYWFTLGEQVSIVYDHILNSNTIKVVDMDYVYEGTYYVASNGVRINGNPIAANIVFTPSSTSQPVSNSNTNVTITNLELKRTDVIQCTSDTYYKYLTNPYSEHILHYYTAKPLRLFKGNTVELITDGNYNVVAYHLRYLEKPLRVNILEQTSVPSGSLIEGLTYQVVANNITYNNEVITPGNIFISLPNITTFTDTGTVNLIQTSINLPEHTHDEIIKLAVNMALENTENRRYQTQSVEVNKME